MLHPLVVVVASATFAQIACAAVLKYQVSGELLTAADGKFAVRTTTRNQYSGPTGATVTVFDAATGDTFLRATSQQILDTFPQMQLDAKTVSYLHYGFGTSAAMGAGRLLVGSPGGTDYCDCSVDPPIDVLGRGGQAFTFPLDQSSAPVKLDAPNLSTLREEEGYGAAADNWFYFGDKVAAAGTTALVNGRTFDLTTGKKLVNLESRGPLYDSVALTESKALISLAWENEVGVHDLSGNRIRTLIMPSTTNRIDHPIAVEGNVAIVGATGPRWSPNAPGTAVLFDIETGAELMTLTAGNHGVMSLHGGDGFGASLAIHGNFALVGAPYDNELADRSGAAYLFDIRTGKLIEKILPPVGEKQNKFGRNVALTNWHALIDDSTIVNLEPASTTYVYAIPEPYAIVHTMLALGFGSCSRRRHLIRKD